MDDALTPHEASVVDRAKAWAAVDVAPVAESWETDRRFAAEAFAAAASAGLTGLLVPVEQGGEGLGPVALARVVEEAAAVDLCAAFSLVVHNNLAGALSRRGPADLKVRYLDDLVSGARLGAFLLTEPGVGSDAAAITTTARRTATGWVLDGAKAWVTNAAGADVLSVYATTDPAGGHRAIAAFVVEADRPGVRPEPTYQLFGGHGLGTGGFAFEGCEVDDGSLFVAPGEGFRAAMEGIDLARVLVAAMCCGMVRTGLETATAYVADRRAFGKPLADLQAVRFTLADVATDLAAARLLTFRAARTLQDGVSGAVDAAHAKKFATRAAEARLADCMQVMGAAGARRDHPLPRHLATARLTHYLDGATEIQDVVIARSLLGPSENA
ncbi:MAG: acyl-CoA dehydrogenase family protein [Acidimicrobiia bacterium]|nr:acyl-CoA dehydrogenase family protein [Acidimicrobiia bacterium]